MLGPVAALVSSLGWGTSDYLGGLRSRQLGVLRVLVISQLVSTVVLVAAALVLGGALPRAVLVPGMLAGAFEAVAIAALYRGLAVGRAGLVAPASAISPVVPLSVSVALGVVPGPWQLAGIVLVLVGLVLAAREPLGGGPLDLTSLGHGLFAALGFGAYFVFMAQASAESVLWALGTARVTALACVLLAAAVAVRSMRMRRRDVGAVVLIGLLVVVADTGYAISTTAGELTLVAALAASHPVVTILWSRFHSGELLSTSRWVGVAVTVTGVVALTASR